jgi:DNA invertase Pin-like site-specific DNA recombinase
MKQTAAYIRVSSDKQDTLRQEQAITDSGIPIDIPFCDDVGRNPRDLPEKRPAFLKMLEAVRAGIIGKIVVDSQDRFGCRDAHQFGYYLTILREHGCTLVDCSGVTLSGDDSASVLISTVGSLTSQEEQKQKARRNVTGKIQKAKRGEYQGGYPAYGLDVACLSAGGRERWRIVYVGPFQRFKVSPDGKREKFDGKGNSPRKDATDIMQLRPSIETERIETVRDIFKWFATEEISSLQIATRLNKSRVNPLYKKRWSKVRVADMLRNPAYIGLPAWNKRGASRFVEYKGGKVQSVARENGSVKTGRRREPTDYVQPDKALFPPIITEKRWAIVQAKLKESSSKHTETPRRAPNTGALWLRPFLVCGKCRKPMRSARAGNRLVSGYFCGSYGAEGKDNATGCRVHRVKHEQIERMTLEYLQATEPKVAQLIEGMALGDFKAAAPLWESVYMAEVDHGKACVDIMNFIDEYQGEETAATLPELYSKIYEKVGGRIREEIAAREAQIAEELNAYKLLSDRLKKRAHVGLEKMEDDITALRAQGEDLRKPYAELCRDLEGRRVAYRAALTAIKGDQQGRKKAYALGQVLRKIVCHFRHSDENGKLTNNRSILDRVEFLPVTSASPSDGAPGRAVQKGSILESILYGQLIPD